MVKKDWQVFAHYCIETFGTMFSFDDDDSFVVCPDCGELILQKDFPEIDWDENFGIYYCPICGDEL